MEKGIMKLSKSEVNLYKELITRRFLKNPRMSSLFDSKKRSFYKNVFNLVNYCFQLAAKVDGVYVTKNKEAIVLYYESDSLKKSLGDYYRYFLVLKGIPILNFRKVLKELKEMDDFKLKEKSLYVWFIAQNDNYSGLDGLVEINQMLFDYAAKHSLPITFETSDENLLPFYKRAGFTIYHTLKRKDCFVYFFMDSKTYGEYFENEVRRV